mgnify:CR=1 FL=1
MNSILNTIRFIVFLLLQVVIFNNILLFGFLNPYPYILFILLFPINGNKFYFLISSFLLGLFLDVFLNSGGVHTMASLLLAYARPFFFKFSFGLNYEYQTIKIAEKFSPERLTFLFTTILYHHLILFSMEFFRWSLFFQIIYRTFLSTLFTLMLSVIIIYLIKPNKR